VRALEVVAGVLFFVSLGALVARRRLKKGES